MYEGLKPYSLVGFEPRYPVPEANEKINVHTAAIRNFRNEKCLKACLALKGIKASG
jgi:hypothetical protein